VVVERLALSRRQVAADDLADVFALLQGHPAPSAGSGLPFSASEAASPMTKTSGCPGTLQSGATHTRPMRSVGAPRVWVSAGALAPAAQMTLAVSISSSPSQMPFSSILVILLLSLDFNAHFLQGLLTLAA
jgi:hypothetical protein